MEWSKNSLLLHTIYQITIYMIIAIEKLSTCPKIYSYLYFRVRNCWQWPTSFGVWCGENYILLVKKNPWSGQTDSSNFVNFASIFSQGCHLGVFNPRKNSWSPWFTEEICSGTQTNSYRVRLVWLTDCLTIYTENKFIKKYTCKWG